MEPKPTVHNHVFIYGCAVTSSWTGKSTRWMGPCPIRLRDQSLVCTESGRHVDMLLRFARPPAPIDPI